MSSSPAPVPTSLPSLPSRAADINAEHAAVERAEGVALPHARRCGELLIAEKAERAHGDWLPWLKEHCPALSRRTSQDYLRIARYWHLIEPHAQHAAHLSVRAAIRLLKTTRWSRSWRAPQAPWSNLSSAEQCEVRRITEEMKEFPHESRTLIEAGPGCGGTLDVISGAPCAPVYWDIVGGDRQRGRSLFRYTSRQVIERLRVFIDHRKRSVVSDLAVDVARGRLAGNRSLARPVLPPEYGEDPVVRLSPAELRLCHDLAPVFNTTSPADTVFAALRFAVDTHAALDDEEAISA